MDALRSKWSSYPSCCKVNSTPREKQCLQTGGKTTTSNTSNSHQKKYTTVTIAGALPAGAAPAPAATDDATATGVNDTARDTCGERAGVLFCMTSYTQG